MDIFKIISAAIIVCIINIVLKGTRPEYALMLSVVSAAVMLFSAAPYLLDIMEKVRDFSYKIDARQEYIGVAIKILGITCVSELAAQLCRDAGEGALAQNVELAGKAVMLYSAIPVIGALFDAIEGVLS